MPATEPVHESVEVPDEPLILVGLRVHDRFVELVTTARDVVLAGALLTVIVEGPETPTLTGTLVGLAVSWKTPPTL